MSSNQRIITILFRLLHNEELNKIELSKLYDVSLRTIQRDFSIIEDIAKSFGYSMCYHDIRKYYYLKSPHQLTFEDSLAAIKILLASRAFSKQEMTTLLTNIMNLNTDSNIIAIKKFINNELVFYSPLEHDKELLPKIEAMSTYILDKKILAIHYQKSDNSRTHREVLPVLLFFSD